MFASNGILLRLLVLSSLSASAHSATSTPDIVGGTTSTLWPAAGVVLIDNSMECSAFLISPTWALTTYYCAEGTHSRVFIVGTNPQAPSSASYIVSGTVLEPAFDENTLSHDVALLHLQSAVAATPFMLNDQSEPPLASQLYVLGYGSTDAMGDGSGLKRLGTLTVTSPSGVTADQIKFGGGVICLGDAGAPNFDYGRNGFPIAFASTAFGDDACSTLAVSIRTSAEIPFITAHVNDACFASAPTGPHCDGVFRNGLERSLNP
jgi:hypothetical protein